uniref:hypothetical protein n=1 Tax=Enterococcus faecium TaxID=1352 RepID=UPI0034E93599
DQDYQRRISNQLRDMFDDPFNPKIIEPPKRVIAETTAIKNVVQREIKKLYRQSLEVNDYLEEFGSKGVSEEIKLADQVLDRSFHDAKHLGALIK